MIDTMNLPLLLTAFCFVSSALCSISDAQVIDSLLQRWRNRNTMAQDRQTLLSLQSRGEEMNRAFEKARTFWIQYYDGQLVGNETSQNISEECQSGIEYLMEHQGILGFPLIVEMVDAFGKPAAGYLEGNNFANGAFDECFTIGHTGYCNGRVMLNTTPFEWIFGMCVPKGCSAVDVGIAINSTEVLHTNGMLSCEYTKKVPYNTGAIIMIVVCFIFVSLVFLATAVDWMIKFWKEKSFLRDFVSKENHDVEQINKNGYLHDSEKKPLLSSSAHVPKEKTSLFTFVQAFSLYKILPTILSTEQPPSAITSLNGIRVMSMFWVIICHTHFGAVTYGAVDNTASLEDVLSRITFQAIENAFFAVDSFFFLSGLLVAYLTLRQMARKNGRFPFVAYYLHRYLRLTPTYAFVLFFIWLLTSHLAEGPSYAALTGVDSDLYKSCKKYWWTNLLYINNFYPWKEQEECIAWTWYLANDMQFFIIAPLIIIPLYYFLPLGLIISSALLFVSFVVSGTLAGVYNFQPNRMAQFAYNFTVDQSKHGYDDLLYVKPWYRITPYIVGLIAGYLFYKKIRFPFNRLVNLVMYMSSWILAGVILVCCLYGLYFTWHGHTPTTAENVIYITFSRFAWGIGLALIVFACHNGYGGIVNSFLSMKFWIPLSRLSYNAYLIHPMMLFVVLGAERKTLHYGDINMAVYAVAGVVFSYGAAALVSVFVEFPIGNVEQAIFKLVGLGGRESTRTGNSVKPTQPQTH